MLFRANKGKVDKFLCFLRANKGKVDKFLCFLGANKDKVELWTSGVDPGQSASLLEALETMHLTNNIILKLKCL